ncbi:MAG TPA: hypothetical protein HA362_05185 [Nanoarchaeota archaeon]|nr:hypothetical protein [Nanoarchaeota archaeon]
MKIYENQKFSNIRKSFGFSNKAILLLLAFLVSVSFAYAANGCAEKTKAGEWCVYTSEDNVAEGAKFTPTSCEQTSYCKIGCCYSSDEGRCFKNTPRAACVQEGATWNDNAACGIDQCQKGCCVLGDQAFFVTEVKCKQTASLFPEVAMVYNKESKTEAECVASVKNDEVGCCVKEDSCVFTSRAGCDVSAEPISGNASENKKIEGFYKDMLCSNDQLNCGCAKQKTTGCMGEDVYWFDSCGNKENIYNSNRQVSYNNGYVLKEAESCTAAAGDTNCGNCDYTAGTVCGADKEKEMPVGSSTCIALGCKTTYEDDVSPNANGRTKKNGESWCVYDSMPGLARDLVGSRHYRHLCINGEEMVEACKDFREEMCVQGVVGKEVFRNVEALQEMFSESDYVEAACRDNRHENCFACNQYLKEVEEETGLTDTIIEKRKQCCTEETNKDCYWLPSVVVPAVKEEIQKQLDGTCVPQVPPGLKFWGDESKTAQAAQDSTAEEGATSESPKTPAEQKCAQASSECTVTYQRKGWDRLLGKTGGSIIKGIFAIGWFDGSLGGDNEWTVVYNGQCTKKDWVVAGNNICKSVGDCGAYYNVLGKLTKDGYINTLNDETDYGIKGKSMKLTDNDAGNIEALMVKQGGEVPDFWDLGGDWFLGVSGATMITSGLVSSWAAGWTLSGFGLGALPFSGVGDAFTDSGVWGGIFSESWGAADLAKEGISGLGEDVSLSAGETISDEFLQEQAKARLTSTIESEVRGTVLADQDAITGALEPGQTIDSVIAERTQERVSAEVTDQAVSAEADALKEQMVDHGIIDEKGVIETQSGSGWMAALQTYMWVRQVVQLLDIVLTENVDETYTITCMPWQAPTGGEDCEKCNDVMKPCSEYKCKSLGASCSLVNQGTSNETCVAMDINDVNSPLIRPLWSVLSPPYTLEEVTEQGNPGYKIKGKIRPFTPIILGISTDEPAACKYDVKPGTAFDNMPGQFGSSMLLYNQTVSFALPSELAQENATKANKGEYGMYIRCKDAKGNKNEKDYFIKFTIDDSPDLTPPVIRFTSLENGGYVAAGTSQIDFRIYVNEYAECKWSRRDTEYEIMEHSLDCRNSMFGQSSIYFGTFECSTVLSNLTKTTNMFFIRCRDQPGMANSTRNTMSESYEFKLAGSEALSITSVSPSGDLYTNDVTMKVQTVRGADNGKATCGFSTSDVPFGSMIAFATTGAEKHEQTFTDMDKGDYKYYISCVDKAGNEARNETNFKVTVDSTPPMITSVYIDSLFGTLHMEFDEVCTCEYSSEKPSFNFGEGTVFGNANSTIHDTQVIGNVYYVKCKDLFDNRGEYIIYKETASSSVTDFF